MGAIIIKLWTHEGGSDAMEYTLVGALLITAIVAGATAFATSVNDLFRFITTTVDASIPAL